MRTPRTLIMVVVCLLLLSGCTGGGGDDVRPEGEGPVTIRVPEHAGTIQAAVDAARPGDTVEVAPGTYRESVQIRTDDLTLRGTDRNAVVLDGEGVRSNGVVVTADRVTVANLTVRDHNLNGVLVTGFSDENGGLARGSDGYHRLDPEQFPPVQGFAVRYVTAANNGLYGIYAFDAQDGVVERSYASGHADSGFYVGQCQQCDVVVRDNVSEYNAVGYEQANASSTVSVVRNRFAANRVGMAVMSDYQEAFVPQREGLVAGNVVVDNAAVETPAHAEGGFGIGIGLTGAQDNTISGNLISGHPTAGVLVTSAEDIPSLGNQLVGNVGEHNEVDVAYTATDRAPGEGNCLADNEFSSTSPEGLQDSWSCPEGGARTVGAPLSAETAPEGISFRDVRAPLEQPQMPESFLDAAPEAPPVTDAETALPPADLYAELAHGTD
ncbi:right-handed parallel beta-helix repeat-containing protein [Desertihabitans aurantiacus]|uniref:right-handed parallel beta-helix repeat-containing protein n=1 Tax=Desertihabitans aurantiacus TaxID=2282477 RepID=UPI0018E4F5EF|nr:right-handed parallel beta-helix repeat-containing protein [Desertihabitans aurantiacus]